jgi:hypothetical protein
MSDSIASAEADLPARPRVRAGWAVGDLLLAGGSVVLAIALFLPWFSASVHFGGRFSAGGGFSPVGVAGNLHGTADGPRVHGYLWVVLVLVLATLAILALRPYLAALAASLPSLRQLLLATTGLALLVTLLGFASRPTAGGTAGPLGITVSVSWSYGAFLAVLAAAVAFAAAFAPSAAGSRPAPAPRD